MANTRVYITLFKDGGFQIDGIPKGVEMVVIDTRTPAREGSDNALHYVESDGNQQFHDVFTYEHDPVFDARGELESYAGVAKALDARKQAFLADLQKSDEQIAEPLKLSGTMVTIPITDDGPKAPDAQPYWFEALEQAAQTMGNIESLPHIGEFLDLTELQETLTLVIKALERARKEGGNS